MQTNADLIDRYSEHSGGGPGIFVAKTNESSEIKVEVYLDSGVVCWYTVSDPMKGREHAAAIIETGYRRSDGNNLEWYPPHRIVKVKVTDGAESTKYRDNVRAT